jgi:hypothetical protein
MSHKSPPLQRWLDGRKKIWMLLLVASKAFVDFGDEPFGGIVHDDNNARTFQIANTLEADRELRFPLLQGAIAK